MIKDELIKKIIAQDQEEAENLRAQVDDLKQRIESLKLIITSLRFKLSQSKNPTVIIGED